MRIIFNCIIIIFLTGCQQNKDAIKENADHVFSANDFEQARKVDGTFIKKINDSLLGMRTPFIFNDHLIIRAEGILEKLFHVIKVPEDTYLGAYMGRGKGPGEGLSAWRYFTSDEGHLGVYDIQQKKVVEFDIDSLLIEKEFVKEYNLPSNIVVSDGIVSYNNRIYFTNSFGDLDHRLYSTNLEGKDIKGYGQLPKLDESFFDLKLQKNDVFTVDMADKNGVIALSYSKIPLLSIFKIDENKWTNLYGPSDYIPKSYDDSFRSKLFFTHIAITEKYIYALYKGQEWEPSNPLSQNANTVYCFDLNGNLVEKIILNQGVVAFDVYNDSLLYGLTLDEYGESHLIKFTI